MPGCAGFGVRDPLVLVVALAYCQMEGRRYPGACTALVGGVRLALILNQELSASCRSEGSPP